MSVSLLLATGCLLTIVASIQVQRNLNWEGAGKDLAIEGRDVAGTELTVVEGGRDLKLKIADVDLDPQDPEREIYLYTVLYRDSVSEQWQNYCQPDRDNVAKAIPLSGAWDRTGKHHENGRITFACTNGVLAKCVRFGYKPWKTVRGRSLRDFHQACTRMVRADYCGNGRAHTKDGTAIDIYDRLSIQTRTPHSGMILEAGWSPDGAVFIARTRWPESLAKIERECPDRLKRPVRNSLAQPLLWRIDPTAIQQQLPKVLIFNDSFDLIRSQSYPCGIRRSLLRCS
ncbi:ADYC domain-containing protein [Chamaesiphon polymorphus]|nr:ADYC domain-containing protein [Chamaesiphon polymorphus]